MRESMTDEQAETPPPVSSVVQDHLKQALGTPGVLRLYANGFSLGLTNADAHIILHQFGQPVAILNLSYTLAKTLSLKLGRIVAEWETRTGQQLVTTDKLDLAFSKDASEGTKQ